MTRTQKAVAALLLGILCMLRPHPGHAQTAAPDPASSTPSWSKPRPPGRLVEVAPGRSLHILCKGAGEGPTVIIVAGMSQYASVTGYGKVQDGIAPFSRVCIFDRAGLGWSDPQPTNWTQEDMVRDMHALFEASGIKGPHVIMGHSMGGLLARLYAEAYREDIAGLILVDTAAGRDFSEFEASIATDGQRLDAVLADARPGVPVSAMPPGTPAEVTMAFTPESLRGLKGEVDALLEMPPERKQVGSPGLLGDLRLIVIRRGRTARPPNNSDIAHREDQEALTRLSSDSAIIVAEGSGHLVSVDAPTVMVDAARRMSEAVRKGRPVT